MDKKRNYGIKTKKISNTKKPESQLDEKCTVYA
jgi:hypothetical protein